MGIFENSRKKRLKMAEVSLLVMLAIVVVSAIVIFKVVKGVVQTLVIISAVASIAVAVAGGFVINDALGLKENLQTRDNLLLILNSGETGIVGGVIMKGQAQAAAAESGNVKPLTAAELGKLNSFFAKKDYESMLGSNYKLIIAKEGLLQNLTAAAENNAESMAALMVPLLAIKISQDPLFLAAEYKKGSVIIYPETPVFKAIKIFPAPLFRNIAEKMFQQVKEAPEQVSSFVEQRQQGAVVK